ncbi:aminoglycoside phosphotransferase family protein [Egibacter rhizosphaerae]|uniref:Aminoglycoside phosphotransferase family protein n=1 Tax=Egibacter rhizosphaerae TaxID=1670831 RepID=A0A411YBZ4_9ACTN|nr:aminoglycoside phosphotransferase family protein [Egibacter rhizosphaerae]QBI18682.1 aminoglycoside phosphotransferase family protein [Egibacter rhizosphaerae]
MEDSTLRRPEAALWEAYEEPLAAAVEAGGGAVRAARPTEVRYEPSRRTVVRFRCEVDWSGRDASGNASGSGGRRVESYALAHGELPARAARVVGPEGVTLAAWAYPGDPCLPGLPSVCAPEGAAALIRGLSRDHVHSGRVARVVPRVYRPTSRAVLEVIGGGRSLFLKVVPPDQAERLARLHRALERDLPVPGVLGAAPDRGVLALGALPGRTLGTALVDGASVPAPGTVLRPLRGLAGTSTDPAVGAAEPPGVHAARHARLLAAVVPSVGRLARQVAAAADVPWCPDRIVHGDFHDAQVLVSGERVTGLLDLDRVRPGDAIDDLVSLLAHLRVLAWANPRATTNVAAYAARVHELATRRVSAEEVAGRVAGALLGLAGWPFRAQHEAWPVRVRELVRLAAAAAAGHERALIGTSSTVQRGG